MCQTVGHFGRVPAVLIWVKSLFSKPGSLGSEGRRRGHYTVVNGKILASIRSYRRTYDNGDNHKTRSKEIPSQRNPYCVTCYVIPVKIGQNALLETAYAGKTPIATDEVRQAIDEALARLPGTATRKRTRPGWWRACFFWSMGSTHLQRSCWITRQGSLTDINSDLRQFWSRLARPHARQGQCAVSSPGSAGSVRRGVEWPVGLGAVKANDELQAQRQEAAESVKLAQAGQTMHCATGSWLKSNKRNGHQAGGRG